MKPLRDEVVIEEITKDLNTKSGIVLQDDYHVSRDHTCEGLVLEVADSVKTVKKGDKVLLKNGNYKQSIKGKEVIFIRETHILAILQWVC